ncbi:MAG TPA: polymer-forming cytoskeletal protein [Rhizomicrobium sp.]|jgi:cytoskeletal protein CcmA (bactofilin family)|nr:polymer-forming cytoskeletal protein [Rhizomicrobium sp.]
MTMFNRNDKAADTAASPAMPPSVKPDTPVTPAPETKRPQAYAQPIPTGTAPQAPSVSVISKALKITGQLESTEDIQIEGEVDGDVRAVSVSVGQNAKIKGTVRGDEVKVSGTVDGKIEAKKVVLTRTARMSGDVVHQDITIESGAFIDGHCRPEFGKTTSQVKSAGTPKSNGADAAA